MGCTSEDCDGDWHTCGNCGGEGEVNVGDDDDVLVGPCPTCNGYGGWACPYTADCWNCRGSGNINAATECDVCVGTGRIALP